MPNDALTDEVRDALDARISGAEWVDLCRSVGSSQGMTISAAVLAERHGVATLKAALSRESAELADALDHITKLEAALSRNTEHDRLMREVVEAGIEWRDAEDAVLEAARIRREAQRDHDRYEAVVAAGVQMDAEQREEEALRCFRDLLTDYEGRSHE